MYLKLPLASRHLKTPWAFALVLNGLRTAATSARLELQPRSKDRATGTTVQLRQNMPKINVPGARSLRIT